MMKSRSNLAVRIQREAMLSSGARTFEDAVVVVATATLLLVAVVLDGAAVYRAMELEVAQVRAGLTTYVVAAPRGVDGDACESLSSSPGVFAAGAIWSAEEEWLVRDSGAVAMSVFGVSPGMSNVFEVLRRNSSAVGEESEPVGGAVRALTSETAAESSGFDVGFHRAVRSHLDRSARGVEVVDYVQVSDVYPPATASLMVIDRPREHVDACIAVSRPGSESTISSALAAIAFRGDTALRVASPVRASSEFVVSARDVVSERSSQYYWVVACSIAFLLRIAVLARRRGEVGAYLSVGLQRADVMVIRGLGAAVDAGLAVTMALVGSVGLAVAIPAFRAVYWTVAFAEVLGAAVLMSAGLALVGAAAAATGQASSLIKDS
jgi:hypothetical protein